MSKNSNFGHLANLCLSVCLHVINQGLLDFYFVFQQLENFLFPYRQEWFYRDLGKRNKPSEAFGADLYFKFLELYYTQHHQVFENLH